MEWQPYQVPLESDLNASKVVRGLRNLYCGIWLGKVVT